VITYGIRAARREDTEAAKKTNDAASADATTGRS